MSSYWINFAATGEPNGEGLPEWPVFERKADQLLELGDQIRVTSAVITDRLDVFDAYDESLRSVYSRVSNAIVGTRSTTAANPATVNQRR